MNGINGGRLFELTGPTYVPTLVADVPIDSEFSSSRIPFSSSLVTHYEIIRSKEILCFIVVGSLRQKILYSYRKYL